MKHKLLFSLLLFLLQSFLLIEGHGFDGKTFIKRGSISWPIKQLYDNPQKDTLRVSSYDFTTDSIRAYKIKAAGISKTNCSIRIRFDDNSRHDLTCTPSQEFYVATLNDWYPAYQLCAGDELLCAEGTVTVAEAQCVKEPLTVYALEIKKAHTFFVGHYAVLTHNVLIPWAATAGLGIAFGTGAATGGTAGSFFGPVTWIGCAVLGGIKIITDDRRTHYHLHFNVDAIDKEMTCNVLYNDAQVPEKDTGRKDRVESIEDVLSDAKPGEKTKGKSKQFEKPGGYDDALKDFEKMKPSDVKNTSKGKVGKLPDGKVVNVRNDSSARKPTLEVYNPANKRSIKIRYTGA
jgi:hypothetical protein